MKTLVIVHLEPDFNPCESLVDEVLKYSSKFDNVLNITSAEGLTGTLPFEQITEAGFRNEEWIWGFDYEYYIENEPDKWIEGKNWIFTNGHEASEILDWMYELPKNHKYTLVGGARNECLQDIYDIWKHLELQVQINELLTY